MFKICTLLMKTGSLSLTEPPSDSMDLHLCLPLLVVLLQPALGLYNCSSEYDRTPGKLTISYFFFYPCLLLLPFSHLFLPQY